MLVAFIALLVAYRKKFRSQLTFVAGEAVLLYCLYLTHSWTGIAGVFLIFAGYAADQIEWKHFRFKAWYLAGIGCVRLRGLEGGRRCAGGTEYLESGRENSYLEGCVGECDSQTSGRLGHAFWRIRH